MEFFIFDVFSNSVLLSVDVDGYEVKRDNETAIHFCKKYLF